MNLKRLESRGLIEKVVLNHKQIMVNLTRARKDLVVARANLDIDEQ